MTCSELSSSGTELASAGREGNDTQPRSGQRRFWRRRRPAAPSLRCSVSAHCRRHPVNSGPVSLGEVPAAARLRAVHASVSASSPSMVTVIISADFTDSLTARAVENIVADIEHQIAASFPIVARVYVRPYDVKSG